MTVQERLADARSALHQLQLGRSEIEVSYDGQTVKYARADINRLKAYISELEAEEKGLPARGSLKLSF